MFRAIEECARRIGGDSRHPNAGFMEAQFAPLPIGDPTAGLQNSRLARGVSQQPTEPFTVAREIIGEIGDRPALAEGVGDAELDESAKDVGIELGEQRFE